MKEEPRENILYREKISLNVFKNHKLLVNLFTFFCLFSALKFPKSKKSATQRHEKRKLV